MKDRVLAALFTVIVFGAGFWAGRWHERTRPLPPPPGAFLGEFGGGRYGQAQRVPIDRAHLSAEIEKLKPQIDAFQTRMREIDAQFDRDLEKVLSAEQRTAYQERQKRRESGMRSRGPAPGEKPLTDEQIGQLLHGPTYSVFHNVVVSMRLDQLNRELKLDDAQREQVRDLLRVRREKFLELVDSSPPPSLFLSRLAPLAQRLLAPAAESAAAKP